MRDALAGRDAEIDTIERLMRRTTVRAVCACGPPGAGKTHLMDFMRARSAAHGAITARCGHRPGADGDDLAPFLDALEAAVSAGLDRLYDPDAGLETLAEALDGGRIIFAGRGSGPLARLARSEPRLPIATAAAGPRAIAASLVVCRWLLGFGQPVIIQIDDWGRSAGRVRELYRRLVADDDLDGLQILATERDDERFEDADAPRLARVSIGLLAASGQNAVLKALSGLNDPDAQDLLSIAGPMAQTPLGLTQVVKAIDAAGGWIDCGEIRTFDRAVAARCLDETSLERLVEKACPVGSDAAAVASALVAWNGEATIAELSQTTGCARPDEAIGRLQSAGAVALDGDMARITHDRFFETFDKRRDTDTRVRHALQVADILMRAGVRADDEPRGALMLERRIEAGLATCPAVPWSALFVQGAAHMRALGDARRAGLFADAALATSGAAVSFPAWREAVFVALDRAEHATACAHAESARRAARGLLEETEADELCTLAYRMSGRLDEAIEAALRGLKRAGVTIPSRPTPVDVAAGLAAALLRDPARFARLPVLEAEDLARHAPMMRAVNALGSLIYEHNASLAIVMASRALPDAVIGGTAAGAASQAFLCAEFGAYARAAAWARLADARQSAGQPLRAVARQYATDFGHRYAIPRAEVGRGRPVEALALAEGDLAVAIYSCQHAVFDALMSDRPLADAANEARRALAVVERLNDTTTAPRIRAIARLIDRLMHGGAEPWRLEDAGEALADAAAQGLANTERGLALYSAMLAVSYGAYEEAHALWRRHARTFATSPFHSQTQHWTFLTALARCRMNIKPGRFELWRLRHACRHNRQDDAHRLTIIEAERARLKQRRTRALALYGEAVDQARTSRCLMELAIVAEAAAEGAVTLAAEAIAQRFKAVAGHAWARLGAGGAAAARGHALSCADDADSTPLRLPPDGARLDQLRADTQAAQRANMAKTRFLATVGHELRTPLQGLTGLLHPPATQHIDLDAVRAGVSHLSRLVDDLMDMAAAEAGALTVRARPFDAARALERVVAEINAASPDLQTTLAMTGAPATPLHGDETRLRQIVSNLLVNALRHGGRNVAVSATFTPALDGGVTLDLEVSDEGPGIELEDLARLFEPFEKGDPRSDGLGLGLPLARRLAVAMGGALSCRNRPEGGFAAALSLPFARAVEDAESDVRAGQSILIVEDVDLIARTMAAWLAADGHDVVTAHDADDARRAAHGARFDVALIDRRLASADDGLGLAETLAHSDRAPGSMVIMSADVDEELLAHAKAIDARVVQKPVGRNDLADLVRQRARPRAIVSATDGARRLIEMSAHLGLAPDDLARQLKVRVDDCLAALRTARDARDLERLSGEAHRLAGLAGHFGLSSIQHRASALETADDPFDGAALTALESAVAATRWEASASSLSPAQ